MTMAPSTQWPVQRLKFVASVMPSNVDKLTDPDHIPVRLCNYVDVYKYDRITGDMEFMPASATPAQIARFALRGGDVLITKDSETPDDIAVPAYVDSSAAGVICGYHLALLRPIAGRTIGRYLFWAICSRPVSSAFSARAQGITRFGLTVGAMGDVPIPLPPTAEQRAIADFLDRETAKIDALIATQERLIALLDEKRQATITHAVTKGLDPNVPMKESRVEWMGDVPAGWQILPLGRIARARCDGPFGSGLKSEHYSESGVRVIRLQNIRLGYFDGTDAAFIDEYYYRTELAGHDVCEGDILIAGLGDDRNTVGRACTAPDGIGPAMVKADCFRFRLDTSRSLPAFVAMQLTAGAAFDAGVLSSGSTRSRIPLSVMATREVTLPPIAEQRAIADFLDEMCGQISAAQRTAKALSEELRERRTALITAAVTGQIDVTRPAITEAAE